MDLIAKDVASLLTSKEVLTLAVCETDSSDRIFLPRQPVPVM